MSCSLLRRLLLIAMLILMGLTGSGHAAERSGAAVKVPAKSITGTWYSAEGAITFKANGTVNYEGKRYYYAVTSGGLIQLSRKGSSRAVPYQLSGGKLTLTVNGKARAYSRRR